MDFLEHAVKQAPGLGVLAFIVWMFIKHMDRRDAAISEMHKEHLTARNETRFIIKENSEALHEQSKKLDEVCKVLKNGHPVH